MFSSLQILNFTAVSGVDATAARSCFLMLVQLLRGAGATIVFAIPDEDSISLLKIHGVILDMDKVFSDLEDALEWCEEKVLFR
jgi:SulP family sulfate permease